MLVSLPVIDMPVEHSFTPYLYCRTITMPAGSILTSKIHRTEHPYVLLRGRILVLVVGEKVATLLEAGHRGITKPGTRRALFVPDDSGPCVWTTFHALTIEEEVMRVNGTTTDEMVAAIEARIIEPHVHEDGTDIHQLYKEALSAPMALPGVSL